MLGASWETNAFSETRRGARVINFLPKSLYGVLGLRLALGLATSVTTLMNLGTFEPYEPLINGKF